MGTEEREIPVHRLVLKARCPFFRTMLTSEMKESHTDRIKLPLFGARAWELLLPFIYAGCFKEHPANMVEVQMATQLAEYLQLHDFPEYLRNQLKVRRLLKSHWCEVAKQGSESTTEWLFEAVKSPTLRDEVESMLVGVAKKDWQTIRMMCVANLFDFSTLKARCKKEFLQLFRRCLADSDSDTDSGEESLSAAERLDKDLSMGSWQLRGSMLQIYVTSCNEALAAVTEGIAKEMSSAWLGPPAQERLVDLLNCVSKHCSILAELHRA